MHNDERTRNLVEVIHQARCSVVALQEIATSAAAALLCRRLDQRHSGKDEQGVGWCSTGIIGEHAMIYQRALLASFLECREDELKIHCALYQKKNPFDCAQTPELAETFENATKWGDGRYDFSMKRARLPALFFVHNGQPHESESFRSITVCSVHLAYGPNGKSQTREKQLQDLASLMPGACYDETHSLYALLGDFNSNASVPDKGLDFTNSSVGEAVMRGINEKSPGHVLALQAGVKTSIGGQRYDEVIVHKKALGRRHAHVYPCRDLLLPQMKKALSEVDQGRYKSVMMGFSNIMSDHLLVYVDLGVPKPTVGGGGCGVTNTNGVQDAVMSRDNMSGIVVAVIQSKVQNIDMDKVKAFMSQPKLEFTIDCLIEEFLANSFFEEFEKRSSPSSRQAARAERRRVPR
jgi:endonuclease/exonuclease/phosphatase family metal-dependent hydrolase